MNSILYVVILFLMDSKKISENFLQNRESFLKFNFLDFKTPFFDRNLEKIMNKCEKYISENLSHLSDLNIPIINQELYEILIHFEDKSKIKINLAQISNSFMNFVQVLNKLIIENKILFTNKRIPIEIKNSILPVFSKLHKFSQFWVALIKCSASRYYLKDFIMTKQLPPVQMINFLVKPFLEIFNINMNDYLQEIMGESLFRFIIVYLNQKKHPNKKIVSNICKKLNNSLII